MLNEQIQKPVQNTLLSLLSKKLFCASVYYFDGQLKRFYLDEFKQLKLQNEASNALRPSVLIVAREFYSETAKSYPVDNKSDLSKLLKLEYDNVKLTFSYVWQAKDGISLVNTWRFNAMVPNAYITLPESLLFALGNTTGQITEVQLKHNMFVAQYNQLIYSAQASGVINSSQRFANATGIPFNPDVRKISADSAAENLAKGFNTGVLSMLPHFVSKPDSKNLVSMLKLACMPFWAILSVYLISSSIYLSIKNNQLEQKLIAHSQYVDDALSQQQQFDANLERYQALRTFLADSHNSGQFWLLLAGLFEHARFNNVRIDNGRYVLRGSALQATALLERISKLPNVHNATFDFPTRSSKGQDLFVIGFNLVDTALVSKESKNMEESLVSHD